MTRQFWDDFKNNNLATHYQINLKKNQALDIWNVDCVLLNWDSNLKSTLRIEFEIQVEGKNSIHEACVLGWVGVKICFRKGYQLPE